MSAPTMSGNRSITQRHAVFAVFLIISLIVSWRTIGNLLVYSLHNESCSHIILVPLVSAYLLFAERRRIFRVFRSWGSVGIIGVLAGVVLYWVAIRRSIPLQGNMALSIGTLALMLVWTGGFLWTYGLASARAAAFPLLFLLLMVPLPDNVLAWTIHLLQQGSAEVTYLLFKLVGIPVLRQGLVLSVPSVTIEVAAECSGIRSTIALFITCLLVAHFYLRTPWKVLVFLLFVFPLSVIKNGIRIVTLTLLSIYVGPSFLHGSLHHQGGFVFFLLALLLLLPAFLALEKSERHRTTSKSQQPEGGIGRD